MAKVHFSNKNPEFFSTLRKRVDSYFKQTQLKTTGNFKLYSKTIILFAVLIAAYTVVTFFTPSSVWINVLLCVLLGGTFAAIGFNVMHDGSHGSYSTNPTLNKFMAFALNLLGGNAYIWNLKHNVNHHSFTNIEGMDDDIDIRPFIRVHADQPKYWFHRFQHVYFMALYGLTYLFWVFWQDFKKYFLSRVSEHTPMRKMTLGQHFSFWISKVLHIIIFVIIPGFTVGFTSAIVGYLILAFTAGIIVAVVFQLAHVVEDAHFLSTDENAGVNVETEWAIHQINTTVNFATRSKVLSWLLGGLNFQVEHHLFPKISHIHYPNINKIVRETCKEFNVSYKEFPTMFSAFISHAKHMKAAGVA
ncbi:MAG: acyl-CoA desaturase [Bacteroidetes bacterium]|nr:MAG: acyl-CoA desaturase [Bacteroidota bacterium]